MKVTSWRFLGRLLIRVEDSDYHGTFSSHVPHLSLFTRDCRLKIISKNYSCFLSKSDDFVSLILQPERLS